MFTWRDLFSPSKDDEAGGGFPTLSAKEKVILQLLINTGEMYGLKMIEASEGELKRGTAYVTLDRMEDKGYIESHQEARTEGQVGIPRRFYKVTGLGRRVYQAWELARASWKLEGIS